ncbi:MAG: sulfatase-like hydrolase/transferase [Planctomycetota bacterium]
MFAVRRYAPVTAVCLLFCARGVFDSACAAEDSAAERPNILWITSEDNAAYWLGCYGNDEAQTPRLDALAAKSVLFERAYSNAPVCAVARSTILHGVYAVSTGTQHMRSRHRIPESFRPYVEYLRQQGYYCTNNNKTDYNRAGDDKSIWDACSGQAHYKNRKKGQPFFAIFNLGVTHESNLFPEKVAKNRQRNIVPSEPRIDPAQVFVPPHLPDLPLMRTDIAIYHDCVTALDRQVGRVLDELEDRGLADDTIVFYYGDHGGATPRGKRYLTDTGVRIPMIVHVPKRWQHLSRFTANQRSEELVAFVDLAPTLLSLCGLEKPELMQGRAFLGPHRVEPDADAMVYLFADRFDELYGMRRGLTDGRYKYIRRFAAHLPAAPCSNYSLGQPGWVAWMTAWQQDELAPKFRKLWEGNQAVEELYDLQSDPWEVSSLVGSPAHAEQLARFRSRLASEMIAVQDTAVIPEPMFRELAADETICDYVRGDRCDLDKLVPIVLQATSGDPDNKTQLFAMMQDKQPVMRYWGALGCSVHGERAAELAPHLVDLANDESACVRMTAAQALWNLGKRKAAQQALIAEFDRQQNPEDSILMSNLLVQLDCVDQVPQDWIDRIMADDTASEYFKRFVKRISKR